MHSRDNILYLAVGVGIGTAVGMLLAPRSGSETREVLRSKAQEGTDYVKRTAQEGKEYVRRAASETADRAKQAADRVKSSFSDGVHEAVEAGKQAYREATEETLGPVGL